MTLPSDVNNAQGAHPMAEGTHGALLPQPMFPRSPAGAYTPPALKIMPDAMSLFKALRRRLVPALTLGLIFAAIVGACTWTLLPPPKIAARTQLYVAAVAPQILFNERGQQSNAEFLRTQAYLVKDRFVLSAALRDHPDLAELSILKEQEDPLQWLEKEITVSFPSPEVMHISLSGDRPEEQRQIVTAVTSSYVDNVVNKERKEFLAHQDQIKKLSDEWERKAGQKRQELKALRERSGAFNEEGMAILQKIALEDLATASKELGQKRAELRRLMVELGMKPDWLEHIWPRYAAVLNCVPGTSLPINHAVVGLLHDEVLIAMASPDAPSRELEEAIDKDPAVADGLKQIQKKHIEIEGMEKAMKPEVYEQRKGKVLRQLADLEKAVEAERQRIRPRYVSKLRQQMRLTGKGDRVQRRERYQQLKELERVLFEDVTRLSEETKTIKKQAVDLAELQNAFEQIEKVMKSANQKYLQMEVEQGAPPRITQPDKEAVLFKPDAKKRKLMVTAGASAAALILVLLAFAWFEFQSRKVHTADEVVHGLGLNLVGTVPDASPRSWLPWSWNGENAVYTQSMLTESVDAARTQLLHTARQEKIQIVMITSALAGEGKTSLASHLAASLARAGRRTIIVDSDLRNPTMHRLFERSRAPGLSEYLRNEADLTAVCRDTPIPSLCLISAGKADTTALQALAFDAVPKLFEQLRLQYDFIIVDSCPVLPVADSLLVGQHVDAVIFSLLRQVSRMPRVYAAYQRLALLGIRMLGAVVNGTSHDLYPADYNYVASEGDEP